MGALGIGVVGAMAVLAFLALALLVINISVEIIHRRGKTEHSPLEPAQERLEGYTPPQRPDEGR